MLVRRKFLLLLPLTAGLCACAGSDARYPSLAMRPFETAPPAPPAPAPTEPTRPPVDAARLAGMVADAGKAYAGFLREEPVAARLARAAAGQPIESDARAAALVAMADLSASRGATAKVLADLDSLVAKAATDLAPTGAIESARGEVLALVESEDVVLERLWKEMGQ